MPKGSRSAVETGGQGLDFIRLSRADQLTMLRVHIPTGAVLVNRLAQVFGPVFAGYSRGSAFNEGGKDDGQAKRRAESQDLGL